MKTNIKYKLLTIILTLFYLQSNSQGVVVNNGNIQFNSDIQLFKFNSIGTINVRSLNNSIPPKMYFDTDNGTSFGYLGGATNSFELGSINNLAIRTYQSTWQTRLFVKNSGEIGINTETPTSELEVNGFTKLGSDAPAIKVKKLTGTSSAVQGGTSSVPHELTASKILNVSVILDFGTNAFIPSSYNYNPGFEFDWYSDATNIIVVNKSNNSGSVLSKPFKILITYEE